MKRQTVEEIDEDGRRRTVTTEEAAEPPNEDEHESVDAEVVREEEEIVQSSVAPWALARGWVRTIGIWVLVALAIVETLLVVRLGFLLGNANPNNGFVDFIYDASAPLIAPFEGIAANSAVNGGVFEPATAIAMVVYLLAALLFIAVIWAITAGPSPAGERSVTSRRRASSAHDH